jgi:quercetin dioxygenase-like cupin family protein
VVGQGSFEAERGAHELHHHPAAGEFLFPLAGSGFHVNPDGSEVEIRSGDLTFMAPNKWHGSRNRSDETALAIFGYLGDGSVTAGGYELPESVAAGSA